MRKNDPISNVMTKDVVAVQVGEPVSKARQLLAEQKFHHLPVLDGKKLVGLISQVDILKYSLDAYSDARSVDAFLDKQFSLEQVMTKAVVSLYTTDTVRDAVQILSEGSFHALPVVDKEDNLQGIVTTTDLLQYLQEQYS